VRDIIDIVFRLYELIVVIRVILSWVQIESRHPLVQFVYNMTEPVMRPIRNILPTERIGIDFSPLILLFILELVKKALI